MRAEPFMAEGGDTRLDEAARLEAALERIARCTPPGAGAQLVQDGGSEGLARRLDALIAELRSVLGRDSGD